MIQNKKIIGLTGNIASGKSTVSKFLIKKGFYVIDADVISREVVAKGTEGLSKIRKHFGDDVLLENGELDRKKLGRIVFSNKEKLEQLNHILHPIIRRRIIRAIEKSDERIVFLDAALIYESGLDEMIDSVWFVSIPPEIQIQRLIERDYKTRQEALNVIDSQGKQEDKLKKANVVINNTGTKYELYEQVETILKNLGLDNAESSNYN